MMTHSKEKPHVCSQCDRAFIQAEKLDRHKRIVHKKEKPYICKQCDQTFSIQNNLKLHNISRQSDQ
jgi:KRAB domain-containing zinc finger protein